MNNIALAVDALGDLQLHLADVGLQAPDGTRK